MVAEVGSRSALVPLGSDVEVIAPRSGTNHF